MLSMKQTAAGLLALILTAPIASAQVLFSDGAEGYSSPSNAVATGPWTGYDDGGEGNVGISNNYARSGAASIMVKYDSQEDQGYMEITIPPQRKVHVRWWELRERSGDFQGARDYDWGGEKFIRVRSDTIGSSGVDYPLGWSSSSGFGSSAIDDGGNLTAFGNSSASNGSEHMKYTYRMPRGEWHMFEYMIDLGTQGNSDGQMRLWIDNVLVAQANNVELLPSSNAKIEVIWMGGWYSGTNPAVVSRRYIDDVVISTQKVGYQRPQPEQMPFTLD